MSDERMKRLIARRNQAATEMTRLTESRSAIVSLAKDEAREDLLPEEDAEFRSLTEKIKAFQEDIAALDERIKELADEEERNQKITEGAAAVRRAQARVTAVGEAATYVKGNGRSYLQDLVRVQLNLDDTGESRARLERHAIDVRTNEEYRDLAGGSGTGGYFIPPKWLSEYEELARADRIFANLVSSEPLPPGTNSISVPKIATGTTVAAQDGLGGDVSETDLTDAVVECGVKTVAGQQDIPIQLLDQSPISFDRMVFEDLMSDYASKLDTQVIAGTNANGQVKGTLGATGINAVTYTDTSPSVPEFYSKVIEAITAVHTNRRRSPSVIVMSPRRWGWILAALDSDGRPLSAASGAGVNQIAAFGAVTAEGFVGQMGGLPVAVDGNIPVNLGSGTNEDRVIVARASDLKLYESSVRTRVLQDVGSGKLMVRLQVYGYLAFTAERQPKSTAVVAGTGLVTPSW